MEPVEKKKSVASEKNFARIRGTRGHPALASKTEREGEHEQHLKAANP